MRIGGDWAEPANYAELGFEDKRNGIPNQAWGTLLMFAENGGVLPMKGRLRKERTRLEKDVQHIRKALRRRFPQCAAEDPLLWQGDQYRAQFVMTTSPAFES
jgi:hypothetical protein